MIPSPDLTGAASAVVVNAALRYMAAGQRQLSAASLHVLLSVHVWEKNQPLSLLTTAQLGELHLMSLPLLRAYVRQLEAGVQRERFYRRGPRLLQLTTKGRSLALRCAAQVRRAARNYLAGEPICP